MLLVLMEMEKSRHIYQLLFLFVLSKFLSLFTFLGSCHSCCDLIIISLLFSFVNTFLSFFCLQNEYIALCDLLKLAGLAESGGQAKAFIAEELVLRNGETETRKTAKIRGSEVIEFDDTLLEIADGYDPEE